MVSAVQKEVVTARNTKSGDAKSGDTKSGEVKVWDIFVRLFHWCLVAAFAGAWLTGEADRWARIHEWLGYAIAVLVGLRLIWGFIGSRHARFGDFVPGPGGVRSYLQDMLRGRARRYLGHNPAGGAMIVLLLAGLLLTAGTGWMTLQGGRLGHFFEEVHEGLANGMIVLAALHVAGVLVSSLLHRENLVWAMISGRKRAAE